MRSSTRRLLIFVAQFVGFFAVFLGFYPVLLPLYNQLAPNLANLLLASLKPPMRVAATSDNSWIVYFLAGHPIFTLEADYLSLIYLNLALLPALLMATPAPWRRRWKLLGWGLLLLVGVHTLSVVALVQAEMCVHRDPENLACSVVEGVFGTGGQLFAVALWLLLTWRDWFPRQADQSPLQLNKMNAL